MKKTPFSCSDGFELGMSKELVSRVYCGGTSYKQLAHLTCSRSPWFVCRAEPELFNKLAKKQEPKVG